MPLICTQVLAGRVEQALDPPSASVDAEQGEGPCCTVVQKRLTLGHRRRFIKLIYEEDPLICPNCEVEMQVVSKIEDPDVIFKILAHTKLLGKDQKYGSHGWIHQRGECAFLTGILDRVVKILTFGAIAFEASGEFYVFLRWRATKNESKGFL